MPLALLPLAQRRIDRPLPVPKREFRFAHFVDGGEALEVVEVAGQDEGFAGAGGKDGEGVGGWGCTTGDGELKVDAGAEKAGGRGCE